MKTHINKLEKRYQTYIKKNTFGKSYYGRNLYQLKLGQGNKKVAVIGGVHGRENLTSLLILKLLEDYVRHAKKSSNINNYDIRDLLNKASIYFIPMLNPDGIEIAVKGILNFDNKKFLINANQGQSSFKRWKANGRGVDLNKQFQADWKQVESTSAPHYDSYKGPTPESEPESKALADLTRKLKFDMVVCFHHSGKVIYWYYKQKGANYQRDYQLAKQISAINGYEIIEPEESNTKAAGYKDWFIKKYNKPGFTIEIGKKEKTLKPLPASRLDRYFKENRKVILELAQ